MYSHSINRAGISVALAFEPIDSHLVGSNDELNCVNHICTSFISFYKEVLKKSIAATGLINYTFPSICH